VGALEDGSGTIRTSIDTGGRAASSTPRPWNPAFHNLCRSAAAALFYAAPSLPRQSNAAATWHRRARLLRVDGTEPLITGRLTTALLTWWRRNRPNKTDRVFAIERDEAETPVQTAATADEKLSPVLLGEEGIVEIEKEGIDSFEVV
jgi:hypothetical protein